MKCTNEAETFSWHSTKILIMELIRNDELTELLMNSPLGLCSSNANLMFSNRHNPPSQREFRWSSYKLREDRKSAQLKWGYEEYEIKKEGPKKTPENARIAVAAHKLERSYYDGAYMPFSVIWSFSTLMWILQFLMQFCAASYFTKRRRRLDTKSRILN